MKPDAAIADLAVPGCVRGSWSFDQIWTLEEDGNKIMTLKFFIH